MARAGQAFLVVEKGDTLWAMVGRTLGVASNTAIANRLKTIVKLNPHIKNPDVIRPGQVIYLGSESGMETNPPSPFDLCQMESSFMSCNPSQRSLLLNNWEIFAAFAATGRDSFVNRITMTPSSLKSAMGNPANVEVKESAFSVLLPYAYKISKTAAKTGKEALNGKFGNFLKPSPFAWAQLEGELIRGLKSQARYLKSADGSLRMIPKNARAFSFGGKVISIVPEAEGFQSFSKAVARGEAFAKHLDRLGKVTKVIDLGLSVKTIHDKWDTKDRDRTIAVETTKTGVGIAWGVAAGATTTYVCGALTLTTGPGGVACYGGVMVVGGIASSAVGEKIGNWGYDQYHGSSLEKFFEEKANTVEGVPWLYKGPTMQLSI